MQRQGWLFNSLSYLLNAYYVLSAANRTMTDTLDCRGTHRVIEEMTKPTISKLCSKSYARGMKKVSWAEGRGT